MLVVQRACKEGLQILAARGGVGGMGSADMGVMWVVWTAKLRLKGRRGCSYESHVPPPVLAELLREVGWMMFDFESN